MKKNGPFDISIEREDSDCFYLDPEICNVWFGDRQIEATFTECQAHANAWIRYMQRTHKKRRGPLVAGLCFFRKWPEFGWWKPRKGDGAPSNPKHPIGMIALCLGGTHCLLYRYVHRIPSGLRAFFADRRTSFVGVGVERDAEKLASEWGLRVENPVELKPLVLKAFWREAIFGYGLEDMAEVALDGMKVGRKPVDVADSDWGDFNGLSDDQIMHASIDAYLAFEVGLKCLKKTGSRV